MSSPNHRGPTAAEQTAIDSLSDELKGVIRLHGLHPVLQSNLAYMGFNTIDMLSVAYSDEAELKADAPDELKFADGSISTPGAAGPPVVAEVLFNKSTSKVERGRLILAWEHAGKLRSQRVTILTKAGTPQEIRSLVTGGPLPAAISIWAQIFPGEICPIEFTGTSYLLGIIYKAFADGEIPVVHWKHRVGKLEQHLTKESITTKDSQGISSQQEIETIANPDSLVKAKKGTDVFSQSLTMMMLTLSTIPAIQHKRQDIRDHYIWFWGPEMGGATPPLLSRSCWTRTSPSGSGSPSKSPAGPNSRRPSWS